MDAQEIDRVEPVVVVGIDGTPHAVGAARWAGREAGRLGVPLRLVAVTGPVGEHLPGRRTRHRCLEDVLEQARAAAAGAGAGRIDVTLRSGAPVAVLAEESRAARLLVLGDRGAGRVEGVLAGSVAVGLLGRAACPVVVVRGPEPEEGSPVVVGLDVSPASTAVLDVALDAAVARGVGLVVVHAVADDPAGPGADLLVAPAAARSVLAEVEHRVLAERTTERAGHRGVSVRSVTTAGRAAEVLLAEARSAQLVVVGSRGRGELAGLVRGSVSTVLVHHAGCPVVVVGPLAARRGPTPGEDGGRRPVAPARGSAQGTEERTSTWT